MPTAVVVGAVHEIVADDVPTLLDVNAVGALGKSSEFVALAWYPYEPP
ncbi:MAG: hypothetical protein Q7S02_01310 [bacterium]|nr:hypothetical protein [bacterium]